MTRKEQVHQEAKLLFKEKGYIGSSMRDLANNIGIEASSLYNHVKSKEELLQNICFDLADQFLKAIQEVNAQKYANASDWIRHAMLNHLKVVADNLEASAVFLNEWRFLSGDAMDKYLDFRKTYGGMYRTAIRNGVEKNEFRKDLNPNIAAINILSTMNWTSNWYQENGKENIEDISKQFFDLILKGIKA